MAFYQFSHIVKGIEVDIIKAQLRYISMQFSDFYFE